MQSILVLESKLDLYLNAKTVSLLSYFCFCYNPKYPHASCSYRKRESDFVTYFYMFDIVIMTFRRKVIMHMLYKSTLENTYTAITTTVS